MGFGSEVRSRESKEVLMQAIDSLKVIGPKGADGRVQGETDDLGLDESTVIARVRDVVRAALAPKRR